MTEARFKLAMAQMLVEPGNVERNLGRAAEMIHDAASRGCRIVVLPECLDVGWTHPASREKAEPVPGPASDVLARAARERGVFVAAGLTERASALEDDGERIFNTAVLISPRGGIVLKHRKINVLAIAQDLYSTGDRLGVARTPLGTVGLDICADNFPASLALGHALARMGAHVVVSPSAWAVDADHDNEKEPYGGMWTEAYSALARLYDVTVVGVSNVGPVTAGPWAGRKCIGSSLAVGPGGEVLARGPYGEKAEALVVVEVEPVPRKVTGTAIAGMLKARGYEGP